MASSKMVHIKADCNYFSFDEQVPANRAVLRLRSIVRAYLWYKARYNDMPADILPAKNWRGFRVKPTNSIEYKSIDPKNKLSVTTTAVPA